MRVLRFLIVVVLAHLAAHGASAQDDAEDGTLDAREIRIGVLAHRGWNRSAPLWTPLEAYIAAATGQPTRLVPVTLASAGPLIDNGSLHFLVTNPGHYVALEARHPMSVLATRKRRLSDGSLASEFGSAIIVAPDGQITSLKDAAGRHVTAVDPRAFGGFQVAWQAFAAQGLDLFSAAGELEFVGFPQDRIVLDVLAGKTDIGIVRSGLLETMAAEGRLDGLRPNVLNANASFTYPEALSTRLYPEWPFLAMADTDAALRDRVALALLATQAPGLRRANGLTDGWGAPASYHAVRGLTRAYQAARAAPPPTAGRNALVLLGLAIVAVIAAAALALRRSRKHRAGAAPAPRAPGESAAPQVPLTTREQEIFDLVSQGLSSKEIARKLGISPKTVEFHRSNLLRKHGARSAIEMLGKSADSPKT